MMESPLARYDGFEATKWFHAIDALDAAEGCGFDTSGIEAFMGIEAMHVAMGVILDEASFLVEEDACLDEAMTWFDEGRDLLEAEEYAGALQSFRRAVQAALECGTCDDGRGGGKEGGGHG